MNDWLIYQLPSSVDELIADIVQDYFKATDHKFHSGGREDIDVRMLGNGRPFVVELISPKLRLSVNSQHLEELQAKINTATRLVAITSLSFTDQQCFKKLTEAADSKVKAYTAIVQSKGVLTPEIISKINSLETIEVNQLTPFRVLHRRTLMNRDKYVYRIFLKKITDYICVCFLMTSAGTYVKEFVHGDLGRTSPSLENLIGSQCDIIQLDVLDLYENFNDEAVANFEKCISSFKADYFE